MDYGKGEGEERCEEWWEVDIPTMKMGETE